MSVKAIAFGIGLVAISGCTPTFFLNGPMDARAIKQDVELQEINSAGGAFRVFRANGDTYGIVPRDVAYGDSIKDLNLVLFLDGQQKEELLAALRAMQNVKDNRSSGVRVVDYSLTSNRSELYGQSSAFSSASTTGSYLGGLINVIGNSSSTSSANIQEIQRVLFRIQLQQRPKAMLGSGMKIQYMYLGRIKSISIDDVNSLVFALTAGRG